MTGEQLCICFSLFVTGICVGVGGLWSWQEWQRDRKRREDELYAAVKRLEVCEMHIRTLNTKRGDT